MKTLTKYLSLAATAVVLFLVSNPAFAQDAAHAAGDGRWGLGLGAGLAMGIAVLGAGLGQGKATAAALEGSARNPQTAAKLQTMMIIGLVFMETLVLFTFAFPFALGAAI
jgi:F-type H+-transporting ATPase subunit c